MSMNRRTFIQLGGGLALTPLLGHFAHAGNPLPVFHYYSARADSEGQYFFTAFDSDGRIRFDVPLPGRGHGMAAHPQRAETVIVARRPGRFLLVVDAAGGNVLHQLNSRDDRHFYGHAEFSPDGRWLFTPENDYENGVGVIGVRDAQDAYRQVGELSSHGIGPHDLRLLSDGRTLAVANGGIKTHPDIGRAKLNLDTMAPALTYVDSQTGRLLEDHPMPAALHQNGIRHLTVTAADQVCFVTQYEGAKSDQPPLVGLHRRGESVRLLSAPADIQPRMTNYCGSVCTDASGQWFAVSSPRGNIVTFWSAAQGAYAGAVDVTDGCGVAGGYQAGEFFLSGGTGDMQRYLLTENRLELLSGLETLHARWDNHMIVTAKI
jgi:hypothetical protein